MGNRAIGGMTRRDDDMTNAYVWGHVSPCVHPGPSLPVQPVAENAKVELESKIATAKPIL